MAQTLVADVGAVEVERFQGRKFGELQNCVVGNIRSAQGEALKRGEARDTLRARICNRAGGEIELSKRLQLRQLGQTGTVDLRSIQPQDAQVGQRGQIRQTGVG